MIGEKSFQPFKSIGKMGVTYEQYVNLTHCLEPGGPCIELLAIN